MILCNGITLSAAKWLRRDFLCVLILALGLYPGAVAAHADDPASLHQKWNGWWELGAYYGTDDSSRGEVAIFQPLGQTAASLFFADLRGKFFEEDTQEGNFALGYRRMLNSGWNLGIWSGLDIRNSRDDNKFWQASGGLEALSDRWDARVNGYAPLTGAKASPSLTEVRLTGNSIFMVGGEEVPLYGIDGEIGFKVFGGRGRGGARDGASNGRRTELRVYGGGFWFDADEALEEVAGPRARIEYRIEDIIASLPGSRLTFEGEFSRDDVRDDKWEIGARIRIPFGGSRESRATAYSSLSAQARRMTEGLERDTDIVTAQSSPEPVEDTMTNVVFDRVAYVDAGGSVTTISTNAGDNSLVVVRGNPANGQQTLQGNQTLLGTGTAIQLRGRKSGAVANFTAPGARPTLNQTANGLIVRLLASNTHVIGLDIEGGGVGLGSNDGIFVDNARTNIVIENVRIRNTGGYGINFRSSTEAKVLNVTITEADRQSILTGQVSTLEIIGTTFDAGAGVTPEAIFITNDVSVILKNSTFTGMFSDDVIDVNGPSGNTLSGEGNIAAGATFGDQFCEVTGTPSGTFTFDIGTCP